MEEKEEKIWMMSTYEKNFKPIRPEIYSLSLTMIKPIKVGVCSKELETKDAFAKSVERPAL